LDSYRFILWIDGTRTALSGATCVPAASDYDCSALLPQLTAGTHMLELSTVDQAIGEESARSEPLTYQQSSGGRRIDLAGVVARGPAAVSQDDGGSGSSWFTCASRNSTCFEVSQIADNVGAVERMAALPDGRLVVVYADGVIRILPNGRPERLQLDRYAATPDIADIAVDPGFPTNRFVYLAAVASAASGRAAVSITRLREVGDTLGEAAVIAADLPASNLGRPALSIGPDRLLYVAVPSGDGTPSANGPYDGLVLRLTPDGAAAGSERTASPVFARGTARPTSFAWTGSSYLLLASSELPGTSTLGAIPDVLRAAEWPSPIAPVQSPGIELLSAGIKRLATAPRADGSQRTTLFLLGTNPPALYEAEVDTGTSVQLLSISPIPLGSLVPMTFALAAGNGDPLVVARDADGRVRLLRLHRQGPEVAAGASAFGQSLGTEERSR